MKPMREYHIEYYWQEEALKKEQRAKLKKKAFEVIIVGAFIILNVVIGVEFLDQLFGVL